MNAVAPPIGDVLEARVLVRTGRRVREFAVEVAEGVVILRGRADSFHVKQLALHAVRELLPTAPVRNAIEVEGA